MSDQVVASTKPSVGLLNERSTVNHWKSINSNGVVWTVACEGDEMTNKLTLANCSL